MKTKFLYKNFDGGDEQYTPYETVEILIPFLKDFEDKIKRKPIIWCPFDTKEDIEINDIVIKKSNFVQCFDDYGYEVKATHIVTGQDIFEYTPDFEYDIIISNPPFKNKRKFVERIQSFKKPYVLLLPIIWLNDRTPNKIFKKLQLIVPEKRTRFFNAIKNEVGKQPTFKASYFCEDFCNNDLNLI